ncbi:hypothetical protein CFP56_026810 [Quercus suber]|uniref:Uncharacterized protein n=1 Tax=Quercus suber TaxID=58331 RepID=A0AAW0JYE9_QUESU
MGHHQSKGASHDSIRVKSIPRIDKAAAHIMHGSQSKANEIHDLRTMARRIWKNSGNKDDALKCLRIGKQAMEVGDRRSWRSKPSLEIHLQSSSSRSHSSGL